MKQLSEVLDQAGKTCTKEKQITVMEDLGIVRSQGQSKRQGLSLTEAEIFLRGMLAEIMFNHNFHKSAKDLDEMSISYAKTFRAEGLTIKEVAEVLPSVSANQREYPLPSDIVRAVKEKRSRASLPPMTDWQSKICNEIGYVPTKAWFFQSSFENNALTVPNQFYADFIKQNYGIILNRVFGLVEIKIED